MPINNPNPPPDWSPGWRPSMGQYRLTITITGDDLGSAALAWLVEKTASVHGHVVNVDTIEHLRTIES